MNAYKLGRYKNRNVYRFVVVRRLIDGTVFTPQTKLPPINVVANTAADAANYALEETLREFGEPCEVETRGVRGGRAHRYANWFSTVAYYVAGNGRRIWNPQMKLEGIAK